MPSFLLRFEAFLRSENNKNTSAGYPTDVFLQYGHAVLCITAQL